MTSFQKRNVLFFAIAILLGGCLLKKIVVDYMPVSVSEEGGLSFVQFTQSEDNVIGPAINKSETTGMLRWYAAPFIAISPDGKKLAYVGRSNGTNNLYMKNVEGGRATIQRTFSHDVMDMGFSPDGKKIAFTNRKNPGNNDIHMMNSMEGMAVQQITSSPRNEVGPAFSPDGGELFFTRTESSGRNFIWSFNTKTSLMTQYTRGFTPKITPDGENMVITRTNTQNQRGEIWMINLKSGMETLILSDPVRGFSSPDISPDGKTIVFVGTTPQTDPRPQNLDIYTINIDGTSLTQQTYHPGHDVSPQWAPDGQSIFFISQRGNETGKFNVWQMKLS
jgi:Tol biopolymer transport system component